MTAEGLSSSKYWQSNCEWRDGGSISCWYERHTMAVIVICRANTLTHTDTRTQTHRKRRAEIDGQRRREEWIFNYCERMVNSALKRQRISIRSNMQRTPLRRHISLPAGVRGLRASSFISASSRRSLMKCLAHEKIFTNREINASKLTDIFSSRECLYYFTML